EWESEDDDTKQPYYIEPTENDLFGFAGIWDIWKDDETGDTIQSCAIITTEANEKLEGIHHRMPVILSENEYEPWLDTDLQEPDRLQPLLDPCPVEKLDHHPVDKRVNSPENNDPDCVKPISDMAEKQ
ncbi:MAG: SOS response-associated peptidase, partial [bacterium]